LGIGDWGLGPIPNPQSPIPNPHPQSPKKISYIKPKLIKEKKFKYFNIKFLLFIDDNK
jgi:hypothetical protein